MERLPAHWVIGARKHPLARQHAPGALHAAAEQAVPLPRNELGDVHDGCEARMHEPFWAQHAPLVPLGWHAAHTPTSCPPSCTHVVMVRFRQEPEGRQQVMMV